MSLEPGSCGGLFSEEASCPATRGEPGLAAPRLCLVPRRAACGARDGFRDLSLPAGLSRGAQIPSCPEQGPQNRCRGGGREARVPPPQEGLQRGAGDSGLRGGATQSRGGPRGHHLAATWGPSLGPLPSSPVCKWGSSCEGSPRK